VHVDSDQEQDEEGEFQTWTGWSSISSISRRQQSNAPGESSGFRYPLLPLRGSIATAKFTLRAGGKRGKGFEIYLPLLMDTSYKFRAALPPVQKLPKNLYTFISNRFSCYMRQVIELD